MGIGRRITPETTPAKSPPTADKPKEKAATREITFAPEEPKFSLEDIIVPESVKEKLLDVVEYNASSQIVFERWGLNKTHRYARRIGINLYGESGTGKTFFKEKHSLHSEFVSNAVLVACVEMILQKFFDSAGHRKNTSVKIFSAEKTHDHIQRRILCYNIIRQKSS